MFLDGFMKPCRFTEQIHFHYVSRKLNVSWRLRVVTLTSARGHKPSSRIYNLCLLVDDLNTILSRYLVVTDSDEVAT